MEQGTRSHLLYRLLTLALCSPHPPNNPFVPPLAPVYFCADGELRVMLPWAAVDEAARGADTHSACCRRQRRSSRCGAEQRCSASPAEEEHFLVGIPPLPLLPLENGREITLCDTQFI